MTMCEPCRNHGLSCISAAGHKGFCWDSNGNCLCDLDCPPDHGVHNPRFGSVKLDPKSYELAPGYDEPELKRDVVAHYTTGEIEVIDYIFDKLGFEGGMFYILGNLIKYSSRANHKGQRKSDITKIRNYSTIALEKMRQYVPEEQ